MRVRLEKVIDAETSRVELRFEGESFEARWAIAEDRLIGQEYFIEFTIPVGSVTAVRVLPAGPTKPIWQDGDRVVMEGTVESIDHNGAIDLRVAQSLVLLDGDDLPTRVQLGQPIALIMKSVDIYPYDRIG